MKKTTRWRREKPLDGGGQGDVYLVTDSTGEYEGVWVQKLLRNRNRIARFEREIRAGLELSHPNVIKVIDYEIKGDRPYLVVEYCSEGPMGKADLSGYSIVDRLRIFTTICRGVGHAHSKGVIHRDVKPDNIFFRGDGTPVVGDFGICFIDDEGERLTLLDEAVGARNFIAPELEDGRTDEIGTWSDVYSLGKLLYWITTGGQIFAREKHRHPKLDLTQNRKAAEIFFVYDLLDKMIVFEPQARFQNANIVAGYVEDVIRRILMNAHPIDLNAPQQCLYCGIGEYRVVEGSHEYAAFAPTGPSTNIGTKLWGAQYFILTCDQCGNVQFFNPRSAKDPDVWKKS